jgi:adenylate cyclase
MGMQVNLASRLETACKPGRILISHAAWALVNDQIDCRPVGMITVKGFARPIRAYEVNPGDENDRHSAALAETPTASKNFLDNQIRLR